MYSWPQAKMVVPIIALGSLVVLMAVASPLAMAGPQLAPPTPTNIPQGGTGRDNFNTPVPPKSLVTGRVYDYSQARGQGDVAVVLEGAEGSWKLETSTDSNGYYGFGQLGQGKALLSLHLPPDAVPVTADWPLDITSGTRFDIDLGYYWGDAPPIPVGLNATLSSSTLLVQVQNNTTESATGGSIEILLPDGVKASSGAFSSQATLDSYRKNRMLLELDEIPAGKTALVKVPLTEQMLTASNPEILEHATFSYQQVTSSVQVLFTYDQQITPQRVLINNSVAASESSPAASGQVSAQAEAAPAPSPAAPQPETETEGGLVSSQDMEGSPDTATTEIAVTMLPITGAGPFVNALALLLPLCLVLGLGAAGWRALKLRR